MSASSTPPTPPTPPTDFIMINADTMVPRAVLNASAYIKVSKPIIRLDFPTYMLKYEYRGKEYNMVCMLQLHELLQMLNRAPA